MGVKKGYLYPESTYNGTEGTGDNIGADGAGNREQKGGRGRPGWRPHYFACSKFRRLA